MASAQSRDPGIARPHRADPVLSVPSTSYRAFQDHWARALQPVRSRPVRLPGDSDAYRAARHPATGAAGPAREARAGSTPAARTRTLPFAADTRCAAARAPDAPG